MKLFVATFCAKKKIKNREPKKRNLFTLENPSRSFEV